MKISNLMTTEIVTVGPNDPILSAVDILVAMRFNGIPVVDDAGIVLGVLTQHDMMLRGSDIHLPTLIKIFQDIKVYGKDKGYMDGEMKMIAEAKIMDIMNKEPKTLLPDAPVDDALRIFSEHHDVNPILIVDETNKLIGLVSRYDMIKLFGKDPSQAEQSVVGEREIDGYVNEALPRFQKSFLFVRRLRTAHWLLISLGSFFIGFLVATFFLIIIVPT